MLKKFLALACAGFFFLQLTLFLAKTWWFFELFVHYAHYYALLGTLLALFAINRRHWKLALLFLTFTSIHLGTLSPYLSRSTPSAAKPTLTILSSNFYYTNDDFEELQPILAQENPDLFMIHEAGEQWTQGIELFRADYPYSALSNDLGVQGIAMASRIPGSFTEIPLGSKFGLEFIPEDSSYRVLGVHPAAPLTPAWATERNAQFADLASYVNSSPLPTVIMGDFNSTPWSPYLTELMETAQLSDARVGFGLLPTWHAHNAFFKIPIDHALLSEGWELVDFHRTEPIAADHYPIVVELAR
ncbi:MAG: endonuclease/exonuclease/phosphatase family protein [Patescibacteria group bacterium]